MSTTNPLSSQLAQAPPHRAQEAGRPEAAWHFGALAGRLTELSGSGAAPVLTMAITLVRQAQDEGEPCAWLTLRKSSFFPADVAEAGVDLDALAVIRVEREADLSRAADKLARSGAFGLIVVDLPKKARIPTPLLARIARLADKHDTAVVCLTDKPRSEPSLGALVSIRAGAVRTRSRGARFVCEVRALKDKRRGPGWTHTEVCVAPPGLR